MIVCNIFKPTQYYPIKKIPIPNDRNCKIIDLLINEDTKVLYSPFCPDTKINNN